MAAVAKAAALVDTKIDATARTVFIQNMSAVVTTPSAAQIERHWDRLGAFRTSKYVPWSAEKIALDIRMLTYSNNTQRLIDLSSDPNNCGAVGLLSSTGRCVSGQAVPGLVMQSPLPVHAVASASSVCCF